jgi:hypothetical protein
MPLEGDAQAGSTLDALLALRSFWAVGTLQPGWSLGALNTLGTIGTGLALYPLGPLQTWITLRTLE